MYSTRHFLLGAKGLSAVLVTVLLAVTLTSCDLGSQNIEFKAGSSLTVNGPSSVTLSESTSKASAEYFVRAFTIKQDYSWSASGSAEVVNVRRDGEYVDVEFSEPGTYEVTVTTTIDGEEYTGTKATSVSAP